MCLLCFCPGTESRISMQRRHAALSARTNWNSAACSSLVGKGILFPLWIQMDHKKKTPKSNLCTFYTFKIACQRDCICTMFKQVIINISKKFSWRHKTDPGLIKCWQTVRKTVSKKIIFNSSNILSKDFFFLREIGKTPVFSQTGALRSFYSGSVLEQKAHWAWTC